MPYDIYKNIYSILKSRSTLVLVVAIKNSISMCFLQSFDVITCHVSYVETHMFPLQVKCFGISWLGILAHEVTVKSKSFRRLLQ